MSRGLIFSKLNWCSATGSPQGGINPSYLFCLIFWSTFLPGTLDQFEGLKCWNGENCKSETKETWVWVWISINISRWLWNQGVAISAINVWVACVCLCNVNIYLTMSHYVLKSRCFWVHYNMHVCVHSHIEYEETQTSITSCLHI